MFQENNENKRNKIVYNWSITAESDEMCLLCLLGGGEDCNNDMIGLVFGCYADELKVGDCVFVLCCAEVRCAHCAL